MADRGSREVYFEFRSLGAYAQIVAIDSVTGVEVAVAGPKSTPRSDLEHLALRKLARRLERDETDRSDDSDGIVI